MNNGNSARDTIALAGWLFADLLLGLGLLFFVAGSKGTPPAPTPTITSTATKTFTPTSTITRLPTYTRYPTFTPIYTFTPYPTFTPFPPNLTYTPYPTFTDVPPEWTYTPYPTYTQPAPAPTYTPFPTVVFGLNGTPFTTNLRVSPALVNQLLTGSSAARAELREQLRSQLHTQIQKCLERYDGVARAGVALLFGASPNPTVGNRLAEEVATVLREEYPRIFDGTVMNTYHFISGANETGSVEVGIYFISNSGEEELATPENNVCNP